jgi:hypothetical protein
VGLTVFALGLYLALVRKRRSLGLTWAAIGLALSLFAFFIVIPYFRGAANDVTLRYGWLGDDLFSMIRTAATRPIFVLQTQLGDPLRQQFLLKLLLPVGFLSLLSPTILAVALPCLIYNLLSSTPSQSSIYFHYIAPLIPFIFLAAIHGAVRLHLWMTRFLSFEKGRWVIAGFLIIGTGTAWILDNPFTHPVDDPYYAVYGWERNMDQDAFSTAVSLIPPDASVATTMAYAPHLASRPVIDLFYHKGVLADKVYDYRPADFLFLNLTDLRWGVNPRIYYAMIETAVGRDGYQAIFFQDDVALLARTSDIRPETGAVLRQVIELEEAGGKYAPTGQETIDGVISRWSYSHPPPETAERTFPFEAGITLLGYAVYPVEEYSPGNPLCLTLYWRPSTSIPLDYTVFVHLRDAAGYVHAQRDNVPVLGFYPTSQWQPGGIIGDMHCFQLPPNIPQGEYELVAGLYDPAAGNRLLSADGTADAAFITSVVVQRN